MVIIYITFPNRKEALKLGKEMVKKRLVACVNIFPIDSVYWWNKKVVTDKEVVMIAKTVKENYQKVEKFVKKYHSYTAPCITGWPVERIEKKYQDWLVGEISNR